MLEVLQLPLGLCCALALCDTGSAQPWLGEESLPGGIRSPHARHSTAHTGESTLCLVTVAHVLGKSMFEAGFIFLGCCTSPACNVDFWLCSLHADSLSHLCCVMQLPGLVLNFPKNGILGIAERGERLLRLWVGPYCGRGDGDGAELLPTCLQCRVATSHPRDQVLPDEGFVLVMGT